MYERCLRASESVVREPIQPHWLADGDRFWYSAGTPAKAIIYLVDPEADTKRPLVDVARLRNALAAALGHAPEHRGLPFATFTFVGNEERISFTADKRSWCLDLADYTISQAPQAGSDARGQVSSARDARPGEWSAPDARRFVSEKDCNLHLRLAARNELEPLTRDGVRDHAWRLDEARWSPDGSRLAASKHDERSIPALPVVDWLKPEPEVTWVRRQRAGEPLPRVELFSLDVDARRATLIDTGSAAGTYLHIKAWLPDGSGFLFTRADRVLQTLELIVADAVTGRSEILLSETSHTWIDTWLADVQYERFFVDAQRFLWLSERDGWRHIYLYDLDGTLVKQLTSGGFPVVRVITVDQKEGWVYFTAHTNRKRPYDTQLCRVDLSGERFACLTETPGQHGYSGVHPSWKGGIAFSPSHKYFIDTYSALDRAPEVVLCRADGTVLQVLNKDDIPTAPELSGMPPEEFTVKAADGQTDLYGVLYKPFDFDPARKYPVIDNLYNAPWSTWVPTIFNDPRGTEAQALAQLGFVVVMIDGRGTPERGKAFRDHAYRNLGGIEIPDHVAAMRQLAAGRSYLDLDRVGIMGGSWGGYLAVRALLTEPDFYRVGVALSPLLDQRSGSPGLQEPYMGLPQDNPAGYDAGSNLALAPRLKGKLLVVQGTRDVNVSFADVMKLIATLTEVGKACDLVVLPGQPHEPTGHAQRRWRQACRAYFQEHLRP